MGSRAQAHDYSSLRAFAEASVKECGGCDRHDSEGPYRMKALAFYLDLDYLRS